MDYNQPRASTALGFLPKFLNCLAKSISTVFVSLLAKSGMSNEAQPEQILYAQTGQEYQAANPAMSVLWSQADLEPHCMKEETF